VVDLVKELAAITEDSDIARILNRCGLKTGRGLSWNQSRVKEVRKVHQIPAFSKSKVEKAEVLTLQQAGVYPIFS
jgi:hypothetical protein